jgi:hypothetical protein
VNWQNPLKPLLLLATLAPLAACAAPPPEKPAACEPAYAIESFLDQHGAQACNCGAAYPIDMAMPYLIYARLAPITGEETVHRQRRTAAADLTCHLAADGDNRITHECFGTNRKTGKRIKATPAQARALIDALHVIRVPENRSWAAEIFYSLNSIQCVKGEGCTAMIEPPCLP